MHANFVGDLQVRKHSKWNRGLHCERSVAHDKYCGATGEIALENFEFSSLNYVTFARDELSGNVVCKWRHLLITQWWTLILLGYFRRGYFQNLRIACIADISRWCVVGMRKDSAKFGASMGPVLIQFTKKRIKVRGGTTIRLSCISFRPAHVFLQPISPFKPLKSLAAQSDEIISEKSGIRAKVQSMFALSLVQPKLKPWPASTL